MEPRAHITYSLQLDHRNHNSTEDGQAYAEVKNGESESICDVTHGLRLFKKGSPQLTLQIAADYIIAYFNHNSSEDGLAYAEVKMESR